MTELGRRGARLLEDLQHTDSGTIPPYNEEIVRLIINEIEENDQAKTNLFSLANQRERERQGLADDADVDVAWVNHPELAAALVVHYETMRRNKRILMAYHNERMNRVKLIRWTQGTVPEAIQGHLSQAELEFFRSYDSALTQYTQESLGGLNLDLTTDMLPPKDITVPVRVLKDHGEVMFSIGRVNLTVGSMHHLPRDEAEPLMKNGILAELGQATPQS